MPKIRFGGNVETISVRAAGGVPIIVDLEGEVTPVRGVLVGADAVVWAAGADFMTGPEHSERLDRHGNIRAVEAAREAGHDHHVAVNLSGRSIGSSIFVDALHRPSPRSTWATPCPSST